MGQGSGSVAGEKELDTSTLFSWTTICGLERDKGPPEHMSGEPISPRSVLFDNMLRDSTSEWVDKIADTQDDALYEVFSAAPKHVRSDPAVVLAAVSRDGALLQKVRPVLRADRTVVMAAVSQNSWALQDASDELKNDEGILRQALSGLFLDISGETARDLALAAAARQGEVVHLLSSDLLSDRAVVLAAVQHGKYPEALRLCAKTLRSDPELVLSAVSQDGALLELASPTLQRDREIVMAAVRSRGTSVNFASEELRADDAIVHAAVAADPSAAVFPSVDCSTGALGCCILSRGGASDSFAAAVAKAWADCKTFRTIRLVDPAAFERSFCGSMSQYYELDFPCRGDCKVHCRYGDSCVDCPYQPNFTTEPSSHACWRYGFKWSLSQAVEADGIMLQLVEREKERPGDYFAKGLLRYPPGLRLEEEMADVLNVRIFRLEMPMGWGPGKDEEMVILLENLADQVVMAKAVALGA